MSDVTDKSQWPILKLPQGQPTPEITARIEAEQKPEAKTEAKAETKSEKSGKKRAPAALRVPVQVRSLKVTAVLPPEELPVLPDGVSQVTLELSVNGQRTNARLNPKSYRRAWRTISESGPENVSVILQGRMTQFGQIEDAGLAVNVKTPKPEPSESSEPAEPPASE